MISGNLFIDGKWVQGSGKELISTNPATDAVILQAPSAGSDDVDAAVKSARDAFPDWAAKTLEARIEITKRYQEILKDKQEELSALIADETGKVLWEAKTEAATMVGKVDLSISAYNDRSGTKQSEAGGVVAHLSHKPHGVVAVFGPYNFPGHLPNGHIVPALIAGNTVVFKPSDLTPAVGEYMVGAWEEAGLPAGVLNLVQGGRECGIDLSTHDEIDGLFFTGSSHTGALLHSEFAGHPSKILALEMGGNNPLVITKPDDISGAVYHTLQSAFITAGQRCTCARRLILPRDEETSAFMDSLVTAASCLKVGPQADGSDPFTGSVISNNAADKLLAAQQNLKDMGGQVLVEMKRVRAGKPYLNPGIIDVTNIENLPDEEYFGPLLQVIYVDDFEAGIIEANRTKFGLSAGIFTEDPELFARFHALSRAGIVNWNRPLTGASGASPFGGVGASGNHRPSAFYAADYCAYPVASIQAPHADLPEKLSPGITL